MGTSQRGERRTSRCAGDDRRRPGYPGGMSEQAMHHQSERPEQHGGDGDPTVRVREQTANDLGSEDAFDADRSSASSRAGGDA